MKATMFAAAAALVFGCASVTAQDAGDPVAKLLSELQFKTGPVQVEGAPATLALDSRFKYLGARDARRVLDAIPARADASGRPPWRRASGMSPSSRSRTSIAAAAAA